MALSLSQLYARDAVLVQIVDAASAEAVRLGGEMVACRPGCTPCCLGPFEISGVDAERLRRGMAAGDPARAARVAARALAYREQMTAALGGEPGDVDSLPDEWDEVACPALDPASGLCDLYEWRPVTCRVFGPAAKMDDGGAVGACELCFDGATDDEIAARAVEIDPDGVEQALVADAGLAATLVAFALEMEREA